MTDSISSTLIRSYVDGELGPEESEELERRLEDDPALRAQVEFEERLRDRVSTAIKSIDAGAPAGLSEKIREALDDSDHEQDTEPPVPVIVGRIGDDVVREPSAEARTRRRLLPHRANVFAIAATLVVIAGVVVVSIFAPPLHPDRATLTAEAVRFIAKNHGECSHNAELLAERTQYRSESDAQGSLSEHMGRQIRIFDLSGLEDGYEFLGACECHVPGDAKSCHLIYQRQPSDRDDPARQSPYIASVFIELDNGQFDFSQKIFEHSYKACGPGNRHKAACFTDGELVYFVICCDMSDLDAVRAAVERQLQTGP